MIDRDKTMGTFVLSKNDISYTWTRGKDITVRTCHNITYYMLTPFGIFWKELVTYFGVAIHTFFAQMTFAIYIAIFLHFCRPRTVWSVSG